MRTTTMRPTLSRRGPGAQAGPTAAIARWEIESRSWGGLIQPLSGHAKRVLCLDAIGLCLASFPPSAPSAPSGPSGPSDGEALGVRSARLARRALDLLRQRADDPSPGEPGEEFLDGLRALRESGHSPAAASIVAAFTEYAAALSAGLSASDVLVVMAACCQAVLPAEGAVPAQYADQALERLVTAQRGLIEAAAAA